MGDKINAGIYIMNQEVLERIRLKPTSLERDIFPAIAADNRLYGMVVRGHWMDLGKPADLLKGKLSCKQESINQIRLVSHDENFSPCHPVIA